MSAPLWLNGALLPADEPRLSAFDRGFALGDGVFETIRAHGRTPLWLDDHLARLAAGAALLGIPIPLGDAAIAEGLARLLEVDRKLTVERRATAKLRKKSVLPAI